MQQILLQIEEGERESGRVEDRGRGGGYTNSSSSLKEVVGQK